MTEINRNSSQLDSKATSDINSDGMFGDPLDEAFNPAEISRVGGKIGQITASVHKLLTIDKAENIEEAELEMIQLASEMINKKQYAEAIDVLKNVRKNCSGLYGQTYKLVVMHLLALKGLKRPKYLH